MNQKCKCSPLVNQVVEEYLPVLLAKYDLVIGDLDDVNLDYLEDLLTSGELTQANGMLSDFAYELSVGAR